MDLVGVTPFTAHIAALLPDLLRYLVNEIGHPDERK